MEKDILAAIEEKKSGFSKGQFRIAKYIEENFDKAAFMTAAKLGKTAGVSESTVVRFASELGFDGYPEMRLALQDMIRNRLTSVQRIEVAKTVMGDKDTFSAVLQSDMEKIMLTMESVDRDMFDKAVGKIVNADHVYILGTRTSAPLAMFMGFYFNLLLPNVKIVQENSPNELLEQIMRIGKNDVLVGLSFPRYSKRTVKAVRFAKAMGASVVAITDAESSPIAREAEICLYAKSDMVSFVDSLVGPLSLINALIVAVGSETHDNLSETFTDLERVWDEYDVYVKNEN
ncbi:MAG: MurR/RpiR family transcriptional regulator [Oscillospiraceae bacterium]|nr:MurR/RpiR family transcriptional regulator [Oscillospiraceae bacterium]